MKEQISQNIGDPEMLEILFRKDKTAFIRDFNEATRGIDTDLVKFWQIRLKSTEQIRQHPALKTGLAVVAVISVITALLARLPLVMKSMAPEDFYFRNLCILIFAGLTTWFIIKNRITGWKNILLLALPAIVLTIFMNLLPEKLTDTTKLAFIHAPLFMAFIFALAFVSFDFRNTGKVSGFIRYCGEMVTMTGLLAIAGAILSGMTISLFEIIGMKIGRFYEENVVIIGVAVIPVIAAWLIDLYPGITDRIAPVIARIFTPLVLLSSVIYLVAISVSGISLSENREFLLVFNILLLGVMAIIVFSLSELDRSDVRKLNVILLFLLAVVTLLIDLFALAAIITRLSEGFTPNRTVVLVSNILILVNLLLVSPDLYLAGFRGKPLDRAERIINRYLPVYFIYSIVVIFIFPLIF
ncbi:MAG: hypothetical protein M0Q38_02680 [Bacteroidales bacterium]|jgi:hypothetical protein|nr:hypothetical protein [Bacteroidales bacterium]